jgi:Protein of unknown function (DUF1344)
LRTLTPVTQETCPVRSAAFILLVLTALVMYPCPGHPQVTVAPPSVGPVVEGLESEGRVRRVDRAARAITLDSGEEYLIPAALDAAWEVVRDGSEVRVRYNVDRGRNIVTYLQVLR